MLTVENGTGLVLADTYASIVDVNSWMIGREDDTAWLEASMDRQEAALLEATTYLDGTYMWKGTIKIGTQALAWPRVDAYDNEGRYIDSNSLPRALVHACCFLAGKAISSSLQPERELGASNVRSKSVGTLSITYSDAGQTTKREWPEVRTMLNGLTIGGGPGSLTGTMVRWS
jgi:hypothetical protein